MRLKQLYIKDFKNLKEQIFDFSGHNGLTVVIGNNSSGKSNLIEAISHVFNEPYGSNPDKIDFSVSYSDFSGTDYSFQYKNGKFSKSQETIKLPKRVVAIYSGEETRLWDSYYYPAYNKFIQGINRAVKPEVMVSSPAYPAFLFLNKFYWNIAFLSLLCSTSEDNVKFCSNVLGVNKVNKIEFKFADKVKYDTYSISDVLSFVNLIDSKNSYSLEEFQQIINTEHEFAGGVISPEMLFQYLYLAYSPKDAKILIDISITYNDGITVSAMSEGQKKLMLVRSALEFAGQEDTMFLLDEPDAHVHLGNKKSIIDLLQEYSHNRHVILTSHSPTLCKYVPSGSIMLMEKGEVKSTDILNSINKLSGGTINYVTGALMLSSETPLILVEGIGDVEYINKAINVLSVVNPKYKNINWDILQMGGAAKNAKHFVDSIKPHIDINKKVIVLLDRDESGALALKNFGITGGREKLETYKTDNWYYLMLPKMAGHSDIDFTIEDYFSKDHKNRIAIEKVNEANGCFNKLPKDLKDNVKSALHNNLNTYTKVEMDGFSVLLDKLLDIINGVEPVKAV